MTITNQHGEKMKFIRSSEDIVYKNPYGEKDKIARDFVRRKPYICVTDGGMIVQVHDKQFDFLVGGEVVTQRAGASMRLLKAFIAEGLKPCDWTHQFEIQKRVNHVQK